MTTPGPDAIEARKWCIETALSHFPDDPATATRVAAELVAILETGTAPGGPVLARETGNGSAPADRAGPGPAVFHEALTLSIQHDPPERRPADGDDMIEPASDTAAPPCGDAAEALTDREQAVFDAILMNSAGGKWPASRLVAEVSDVPVGSVQSVLERLLRKGYLARVDGRWRVARDVAGAAA